MALSQNDASLRQAACSARTEHKRIVSSASAKRRRKSHAMNQGATLEGTKLFAEKWRGRAAEEHFRETHGLVVSSIGIGTYLGQPDPRTDEAYTESVVAAVENGINFIDSAINYRFQRSER